MALLERTLVAATLLLLCMWLFWAPSDTGRPADAIGYEDDSVDVQEPPVPSGLPRVPSVFRHKYPRDAVVAQARSMNTEGQQTTQNYIDLATTIYDRAPANVLVFGLGRDTALYYHVRRAGALAPGRTQIRPRPHCRPRRAWGAGRGAGQRRRRVRLCGRVAGVDCQG